MANVAEEMVLIAASDLLNFQVERLLGKAGRRNRNQDDASSKIFTHVVAKFVMMTLFQSEARLKGSVMRYQTKVNSPVGMLRLFAEDETLVGLYFQDHSPAPRDTSGKSDAAPFAEVVSQLEAYFERERDEFALALRLDGTEFQQSVWKELRTIKLGATFTYGEIAERCDRANAVRAVGAAVGRNPISIIVPCHRVVGANGKLTGFAGGLDRKRWLLDREGKRFGVGLKYVNISK